MQPANLRPGDSIGIVAPAGKIKRETIDIAVSILESWGFKIDLGQYLFSEADSYFSGTDEERLEDLQKMLDDPKLKAILCARGGYGTTRIIDRIDFSNFLKYPKWIVGFSDVTVLHLKLHQLGTQSIHSIMPIQFPRPEHLESTESLRRVLFGQPDVIIGDSTPLNRLGRASGQVIGGNLSLLVDSLGTSTEMNMDGKILVIEEVDEYRYKLDRMLIQMKRAKKLDQLAALIVGHMTDIHDSNVKFGQSVEEIVLGKVKDLPYPVAFNFPIGHEAPNLAWRHGALGSLTVTEIQAKLEFATS